MLIVFFRALILYAVLFVVIRLMGKKELAKVQPFELVIIILIADLAASPMSSRGIPIFDGIIPIFTLLITYIIVNVISKANTKVQDIICGTISVIIKDGKIIEEEFLKQNYTLSDLMSQLREKDIFKVQDVKYAVIETNGNLNLITYEDDMNNIPLNIVEDGKIATHNLEILGISEDEVNKIVEDNKLNLEDILIGTMTEKSEFMYQLKGEVSK